MVYLSEKDLGWGSQNKFSPFRQFHQLFNSMIWKVLPQLSCGDTWHIGVWFKVSNLHITKPKFTSDLLHNLADLHTTMHGTQHTNEPQDCVQLGGVLQGCVQVG